MRKGLNFSALHTSNVLDKKSDSKSLRDQTTFNNFKNLKKMLSKEEKFYFTDDFENNPKEKSETMQLFSAKHESNPYNESTTIRLCSQSKPKNLTLCKASAWFPTNWPQHLDNIRLMRQAKTAPVDKMGCLECVDRNSENSTIRFQILVALMLSSQTKDQITFMAMQHLKEVGCTPKKITALSDEDLGKLIYPVGFWKVVPIMWVLMSRKTKLSYQAVWSFIRSKFPKLNIIKMHSDYETAIMTSLQQPFPGIIIVGCYFHYCQRKVQYLKKTSSILLQQYAGDIPNNVKELCSLPGVGPKMAHICMQLAWNKTTGIGVDTHVHRISNRLKWMPESTKTPEETRVILESWIPKNLWSEINHLLVGFGQEICQPKKPKCSECINNTICPYSKEKFNF